MKALGSDSLWTPETIAELQKEYGETYRDRTTLVTGAQPPRLDENGDW